MRRGARSIANEHELQERLRARRGASAAVISFVLMETLPVAEQWRLVSRARVLAGVHGLVEFGEKAVPGALRVSGAQSVSWRAGGFLSMAQRGGRRMIGREEGAALGTRPRLVLGFTT